MKNKTAHAAGEARGVSGPRRAPPGWHGRKLPALALPLLLAACGHEPPPPASSPWLQPSEGQPDVTSGTPLEPYFPLVDGMIYTYRTFNEVGEEGLLVARVHRRGPGGGELRFSNGAKEFAYAPGAVVYKARAGDAPLLQAPLEVGTSWRGEHGGTTKVIEVKLSLDVPAGHYDGCVRTLEERLGDRPVRYASTFCPGVGLVKLEAATGANYERAELKTYGPPMRMRADGADRTQSAGGRAPAE